MFHEVRVFKPDGQLKKTISIKTLGVRHWKDFKFGCELVPREDSWTEPKQIDLKICVICSVEFPPPDPRQLTCSESCNKKRKLNYGNERYRKVTDGTFVPIRKLGPYKRR